MTFEKSRTIDPITSLGLCAVRAENDQPDPEGPGCNRRGVIHREILFAKGIEHRSLRGHGAALLGLEAPSYFGWPVRLDGPVDLDRGRST